MKFYNTVKGVFCMLSLSISLTSCVWQSEPQNPLMEGRQLEKEGQYLEARTHYQELEDPDIRAISLHNLHHLYGHIIAAMQARQDAPNSPEAYYELGKAYYEEMLSIPDDPVEILPNIHYDTAQYFAARRQQLQGNAQQALETATRLQSPYPDALGLKARVYETSDSPEKAIPIYKQMIADQTDSAEAYYRLAALLYNQGDQEQALEYAREAVSLFPENEDAYFVLGKLYGVEERNQEAIEAFQYSLCLNPYYSDAYYRLAQAYLMEGNVVDAERVLRSGLIKNPDADRILPIFLSVKQILDEKQMNEFMSIYDTAITDIASIMDSTIFSGQDIEPDPVLEIRYFKLLIRYLERMRPYILPCSDAEAPAYFERQINAFQQKIAQYEKILTETQEEPDTQ